MVEERGNEWKANTWAGRRRRRKGTTR